MFRHFWNTLIRQTLRIAQYAVINAQSIISKRLDHNDIKKMDGRFTMKKLIFGITLILASTNVFADTYTCTAWHVPGGTNIETHQLTVTPVNEQGTDTYQISTEGSVAFKNFNVQLNVATYAKIATYFTPANPDLSSITSGYSIGTTSTTSDTGNSWIDAVMSGSLPQSFTLNQDGVGYSIACKVN